MKKILFILFIIISEMSLSAEKINVVFVNPGYSNEVYWVMVTNFMKASAKDLGINLEVVYAERSHIKQIELSKKLISKNPKPDYMIVVNEKLVAPSIIEEANKAGVKTLLILVDLADEQKIKYGTPRKNYKNWLGSIMPNNIQAGYNIGAELIKEARKKGKNLEMIAINGSRATLAAVEREEGLMKLLSKNKDVKLNQVVFAEWEMKKGYDSAKGLITRYPKTTMIWCANDLMAEGAIKAVEEVGKIPGKDILIGGLNWSDAGIKMVKSGKMVTTVGGHFMVGGFSLVMIYDYENGIDFASSEGLEIQSEVFGALNIENIDAYIKNYGDQNWEKLDFKKFSKKLNPKLEKYDFSLKSVLKNSEIESF